MNDLQTTYAKLKERGLALDLYIKADHDELYEIFKSVIEDGSNFLHEDSSPIGFQKCFFAPESHIYVCRSKEEVVGGFYLKPNFPGRGQHIANAAYMVRDTHRGNGIGRLLVEASLGFAKKLGFKALQYNIVFSRNLPAVILYQKLGFSTIGTLPQAIRNPDGTYQDGYIMFRPT